MESRCHQHHSHTTRNLPNRKDEQSPICASSRSPGRLLLQELYWQFQQRECLALNEELQHRSCHEALGYQRLVNQPSLLALIPASECKQLERLCACISPAHTRTVIFRFREILAHNAVLPWELVYIFKQVLKDFVRKQEEAIFQCIQPPSSLRPVSSPLTDNSYDQQMKNSPSTSPVGPKKHREEIPTISSYVDRHFSSTAFYYVQRVCLPYSHFFPYDEPVSYSTTL